MIKGSKIIDIAKKYLDESGLQFCKAYGLNYTVDWCVIYVWYVFKAAKACELFYGCNKVCNVGLADSWLRKHATFIPHIEDALPGDIIIMTWSNSGGNNTRVGNREHIGLVVKSNGKKSVDTIEGNTGSKYNNKSKVLLRTRPLKNIYAIYRPNYAKESKTDVKLQQMVKDTLSGKYGSGEKRKHALGSDYNKVQKEVTRITKLTDRTLKGEFGNGEDRKQALGSDYDIVQWNINRLAKEKEKKKNEVSRDH